MLTETVADTDGQTLGILKYKMCKLGVDEWLMSKRVDRTVHSNSDNFRQRLARIKGQH